MARTLSVPRGSGFAAFAANFAWKQALCRQVITSGYSDPQRLLLIALAVTLVLAGVSVPHLDDQSLSTVLFLAGTGLAAALLRSPSQTLNSSKCPTSAQISAFQSHRPTAAKLPARFSELTARQNNPALDRAQWVKLTAHMSHELRTPLNAVLGFSEMMSNEVFGPLGSNLYSAYARDIHASGRLLLKSAEDALAITALLTAADRKGSHPATNLSETFADAAAFAGYDLKSRSIPLATSIDGALKAVGEPQALRQVLINLLAEAASNAEDGATISVIAAPVNDRITLKIEIDKCRQDAPNPDSSFPLILARTLCELSGARLTCSEQTGENRAWTIDFVATMQNDLFA